MIALVALTAQAQVDDTALWYHGNQGTDAETSSLVNHVSQTLGGTLVFEDDWANVDLDGHRFVVISRPREPLTADQIADLVAYRDGGGFVVFAGESAQAGVDQIDTINAALTAMGQTMQLQEESWTNDLDSMTSLPQCLAAVVPNDTPLLDTTQPISMQDGGDLDAGAGTIVQAYNYQSSIGGTANYEVIAVENRVLLTADYDFFTAETCGMNTKPALWTGLWQYRCDLDFDGSDGLQCGGVDCDDNDPNITGPAGFIDLDGDGFGGELTCEPGGVGEAGDCNDSDPEIHPGATEACDGVDNDCTGGIDDLSEEATDPAWYPDFDGDGFASDEAEPVVACESPEEYVAEQGDCDDTEPRAFPGGEELCNNGIDENCDGTIDENCSIDTGDGGGGGKCATQPGVAGGLLLTLGMLGLRRRERR